MDVVHRRAPSSSPSSASGLNPNAPLFVPMAYRAVEDFSDQWWHLVESSPWFRDYWFRQQQQPQQQKRIRGDLQEEQRRRDVEAFLLADEDSLFHGYQPAEEEKRYLRDVTPFQGGSWTGALSPVEERRVLFDKSTPLGSIRSRIWNLERPI